MHEDGIINTYYAFGIHGYTWRSFIKHCVQTSHLPHLCHRGLGGHSISTGSMKHYRNRSCDFPRGDKACWSLQKAMIISQLALQDSREVNLINNTTWSNIDCLMYLRTTDWSAVENRSVLHCVVKSMKWVTGFCYTPKADRLQPTPCCPTLKTFQYAMDVAPLQKCTQLHTQWQPSALVIFSSLVQCTEPRLLSTPCRNRLK